MENLLPEGYRFRMQWIGWRRTLIAGRMVRFEWVRVVQRRRVETYSDGGDEVYWDDVGYFEEVWPRLESMKDVAWCDEL